jgi:glycosyltransferase involved in cell wall biosynthesis
MAGRILFCATEDWFIKSHFMGLIEAAHLQGLRPLVAARFGSAKDDLRAAGAELCELSSLGRGLSPFKLMREVSELSHLIARERPTVIHAIALKPAFLIALARVPAHVHVIYAVTGLGHLGTERTLITLAMRGAALALLAFSARKRAATIVVENTHDARKFRKRGVDNSRIIIVPGAGVDPTRYSYAEPSPAPPLHLGLAARLVRSKGVDLAVEAVKILLARGLNVTLDIAGEIDRDNPASHTESDIARWNEIPGVRCHGWVSDMNTFWATKHVALAPSRGGEGLPRSMLEAAAAGRPLITTPTPGCRDFVVQGETGLIVATTSALAIAEAIEQLAHDPELRVQMGRNARALVKKKYTKANVVQIVSDLWLRAHLPIGSGKSGAQAVRPRSVSAL